MDKKILKDLACPSKSNRNLCQGRLRLKKCITSESRSSEIREGVLKCTKCRAEYPILSGIPILMQDIKEYLRENYYHLIGVSRLNGVLSQEMHSHLMSQILLNLKSPTEKLFPKQRRYNKNAAFNFSRGISSSLINHYDNLMDIIDEDDPLYEIFYKYAQKNTHSVLEEMVRKNGDSRGVAVEVGCGVGGLTVKLSRFYDPAYGVDTSLEMLLLARRIVKRLPRRLSRYRICQERNKYCFRNIKVERRENVEFICASGNSLPFRDKSIDVVCSCNVIDVAQEPMRLLQEKIRILKNKGIFLIADPYDFSPSRMKEFPKSSRKPAIETIKETIKKRIKIIEERDNIPWITRRYKRNYEIYLNHCLAGMKKR